MKFVYMGATLFLLLGCSEDIRTVDYYINNEPERALKTTECRNNPGELMHTPNCKNAAEAERRKVNRSGLNKEKLEQWIDGY